MNYTIYGCGSILLTNHFSNKDEWKDPVDLCAEIWYAADYK
jgi:hypothetical protein